MISLDDIHGRAANSARRRAALRMEEAEAAEDRGYEHAAEGLRSECAEWVAYARALDEELDAH